MRTSVWASIGRRNQIVVLAALLCLAVAAASGGCYAHRVPQAVSADPALQQALAGMPLPYTVAVVPWNSEPGKQAERDPQVYAKSLESVLASSKAFRTSRLETTPAADADLVAMSVGLKCESSVIPVFTILSAGLIPTVFDGESCDGMIIRSAKPSTPPPVEIRIRQKGQTVVGWAAVVFGALPGWSWGVVGDDRRYDDLFRAEIAKSRTAIDELAKAVPPPGLPKAPGTTPERVPPSNPVP